MTVSLCVIMLEMCDSQGTLPFLMVVIIVAKGVADRLGDSILLRRIKLKNLPFLERMPHLTLRRGRHSAHEIVKKMDFPMLPKYTFFVSMLSCILLCPPHLLEVCTAVNIHKISNFLYLMVRVVLFGSICSSSASFTFFFWGAMLWHKKLNLQCQKMIGYVMQGPTRLTDPRNAGTIPNKTNLRCRQASIQRHFFDIGHARIR